ncbi:hypothetical protein C2845_PM13G19130 [Panicum miliaceum]|uniref:Uncharacterized protein n=1 Tax=Panicum miliaceum TaxID=4540 RepID=A0A3L6RJ73_PANMI|nr:hypothetical protein C2845_PM13G19130 [Panicum miliaceum]
MARSLDLSSSSVHLSISSSSATFARARRQRGGSSAVVATGRWVEQRRAAAPASSQWRGGSRHLRSASPIPKATAVRRREFLERRTPYLSPATPRIRSCRGLAPYASAIFSSIHVCTATCSSMAEGRTAACRHTRPVIIHPLSRHMRGAAALILSFG